LECNAFVPEGKKSANKMKYMIKIVMFGHVHAVAVSGLLLAVGMATDPASGADDLVPSQSALALGQREIELVPEGLAPQADASVLQETVQTEQASHGHSDADLLCLAKIVHHESANQTEHVQLAVAAVVLKRVESPRFPKTICAVALQPNQFFNVHKYHPYKDPRWETSQRIARDAAQGKGRDHARGALFFRSAGYQSSFFRSRPHIVRLGGLDFHG
jgi:spore germination cell wall hydrolase CwlJ-like protein